MKTAIIIANGEPVETSVVLKNLSLGQFIVCADGGANFARKINIKPNVILGDFDSITEETQQYFSDVQKIHMQNQETTDLEKAIIYCIEKKIKKAILISVFGNRIDHVVGALGCMKKYSQEINLKIVDSYSEIIIIDRHTKIRTFKGEKISLIPLERCEGVTTANLKYELNNESLQIGVREGISNESLGNAALIDIKKGALLLYRFRNTV